MSFFARRPTASPVLPAPSPVIQVPRTPSLSELLPTERIFLVARSLTNAEVLGKLVASMNLTDPAAAAVELVGKDSAGMMAVAPGVGLPHARVSGLDSVIPALAIRSGPPEEGSAGLAVILAFVSPAGQPKQHLSFLATVAALFGNPALPSDLGLCKTASEVVSVIRRYEQGRR